MAGIYIPGAKTPESCWSCNYPITVVSCPVTASEAEKNYYSCRFEGCPLIPVPDHGSLIDANFDPREYVTVWECNCSEFGKQTVMAVDDLAYLPTIIPGDKETQP